MPSTDLNLKDKKREHTLPFDVHILNELHALGH